MKLLRHGWPGQEKPGIFVDNGDMRDLSRVVPDIAGDVLIPESIERLQRLDFRRLPAIDGQVRIAPCIGGSRKFVCIGLNYADHAAEAGMNLPEEPMVFVKATSAMCGPNDMVIIPHGSKKTDWEVELAAVIGKPEKCISEASDILTCSRLLRRQ